MKSSFIRINNESIIGNISLIESLYKICQVSCVILIIYYCWYVEAFGNQPVIVYGSFLLMSACLLLIHSLTNEIRVGEIPFGIWNYTLVIAYSLIVGTFVSYDYGALLHAVRQYLIFFVIVYAFCVVSNHTGAYEWILVSINVAILICCVHLSFFGHHYSANRIVLSSNSNPNILGSLLNLGLFSIVYRTRFRLIPFLIAIPQVWFVFYNVVMTGSRKSFIVSIAILIIWSFAMATQVFRNGSAELRTLFILVLVCGLLAFYYFYGTFIINTEVIARMGTMGNEESNSARIVMYKEAYRIFTKKPLFGGGLDQYRYWSARGGYSHSTYAEAIADFGLIGSILYFMPFVFTILQTIALVIYNRNYHCILILGLCLIELFLGTVQIWFFEMVHIFTWGIIFIIIHHDYRTDKSTETYANVFRRCRYVKH